MSVSEFLNRSPGTKRNLAKSFSSQTFFLVFFFSFQGSRHEVNSSATSFWQLNAESKNHKTSRMMGRKKESLRAWSFEGISQGVSYMNAFISIQKLTHGWSTTKDNDSVSVLSTQITLLTFRLYNEEILSACYFGPCDADSCKSVQLLARRDCDCDSWEREYDLDFKFSSSHECFRFSKYYDYR